MQPTLQDCNISGVGQIHVFKEVKKEKTLILSAFSLCRTSDDISMLAGFCNLDLRKAEAVSPANLQMHPEFSAGAPQPVKCTQDFRKMHPDFALGAFVSK